MDEALAFEPGEDVGATVASRIQGYNITVVVTLILPLSTFALFWSPRARTRTAVFAEGFEVVIRHWRQNKLELRKDSAGFAMDTMAASQRILFCKNQSHNR